MPRPQARCRVEAAELEGTRELQRVFFDCREKRTFCVCDGGSGSGLEEALFRTCSPWGLPGILSEEAVLMVSFLPFFFFPLPLYFLIIHLPVHFLLLLPPFLRWLF